MKRQRIVRLGVGGIISVALFVFSFLNVAAGILEDPMVPASGCPELYRRMKFETGSEELCGPGEAHSEPRMEQPSCNNPYSPDLVLLLSTVDEAVHGTSIPVGFIVTTRESAQTHQFRTGQRYDFSVYKNGEEVWRWSDDRVFLMAIGEETYSKDPVLYFERIDTTSLPLHSGTYTLQATLVTEGVDGKQVGHAYVCTTFKLLSC